MTSLSHPWKRRRKIIHTPEKKQARVVVAEALYDDICTFVEILEQESTLDFTLHFDLKLRK